MTWLHIGGCTIERVGARHINAKSCLGESGMSRAGTIITVRTRKRAGQGRGMEMSNHGEGLGSWGRRKSVERLGCDTGSGTIAQVLRSHRLLLHEFGAFLSLLDLGTSVLEPNLDGSL